MEVSAHHDPRPRCLACRPRDGPPPDRLGEQHGPRRSTTPGRPRRVGAPVRGGVRTGCAALALPARQCRRPVVAAGAGRGGEPACKEDSPSASAGCSSPSCRCWPSGSGVRLLDDETLRRLFGLVAVLAVLSAIYGLVQQFVGFPSWDARWISSSGYSALNVDGVLRAFGSFASSQEYAVFLSVGLVILSIKSGAGRRALLPLASSGHRPCRDGARASERSRIGGPYRRGAWSDGRRTCRPPSIRGAACRGSSRRFPRNRAQSRLYLVTNEHAKLR